MNLEELDHIALALENFDATVAQPGYIALLASVMLNMAHSLSKIERHLSELSSTVGHYDGDYIKTQETR